MTLSTTNKPILVVEPTLVPILNAAQFETVNPTASQPTLYPTEKPILSMKATSVPTVSTSNTLNPTTS